MSRMVDADELVSAFEISGLCEVQLGTVYKWANSPEFPVPVMTFGKKFRVWIMSDVSEWLESHKPPQLEHGTWQRHRRGCRCPECRRAWAAYMRQYRADRAARTSNSSPVGADGEVSG